MSAETVVSHALFEHDGELNVEDALNDLLRGSEPVKASSEDPSDENEDIVRARQQHDTYANLSRLQLAIRARMQAQRATIASLQKELDDAQAQDRMHAAQEPIAELFTQINHLRAGATESEVIVREITREIRTLDLAKRNIVTSITGIKRFHMLNIAFDQLRKHAKAKRYKECSQSLLAVKEMATHFRTFTSIERVSTILRGLQETQSDLREQITKDFDIAFNRRREPGLAGNAENIGTGRLSEACLVLEAIGPEAKQALLAWYCNLQLKEYRRIFRPTEEAGQLDNLSRRFGWFRRALKQHEDETSQIFPEAWNLPGCLLGAFSAVTRDDLKSVLVRVASGLGVSRLLEALKETTDFETDISHRLSPSSKGKPGLTFAQLAALSPITHGTAAEQTISAVFEPYLGIYVDAQDRLLADMISNWRSKPKSMLEGAALNVGGGGDRASSEGESGARSTALVLPSSAELFHFYRETLERCAQLSTKNTFLELCNVYKKWLKMYAEEVLGEYLSKSDRRSTDGKTNQQELLQACTVLNTADYCAETIVQLEQRLKDRIHPDFKDRVSLGDEKELFTTVISTAILAMLKELEMSTEPAFTAMLRSPWKDASIVSTESHYVLDLVSAINRVADLVKTEIEHRKYFRNWCDKAVGLIVTRFTQAIVRARPISPIGAEQILLDLQRLKSCLLHLPKLTGEGSGSSTALASYNRVVAKSLAKVDIMLQVIMSPASPAEGFVDHYLVLIPCQSFSDFQKMLDLKGVKRSDQNNLLDIFLARTSLLRDLADTSVLSSLEMDVQGAHTAHNPSQSSQQLHSTSVNSSTSPFGLGLPSIMSNSTSPNSALAHNLNMLMHSLPMLHTTSTGANSVIMGNSASASGTASRSGTPRLEQGAFGHTEVSAVSKFGLKKIGRLFTQRDFGQPL